MDELVAQFVVALARWYLHAPGQQRCSGPGSLRWDLCQLAMEVAYEDAGETQQRTGVD